MLATLLAAIRADVDRQIGWAKHEVTRQTRHGVLIGALAAAAALAVLGAIIVGLIALYTWLAPRHGPFAAYGMVGGGLLLTGLVLFALSMLWRRPGSHRGRPCGSPSRQLSWGCRDNAAISKLPRSAEGRAAFAITTIAPGRRCSACLRWPRWRGWSSVAGCSDWSRDT